MKHATSLYQTPPFCLLILLSKVVDSSYKEITYYPLEGILYYPKEGILYYPKEGILYYPKEGILR